MFVCRSSECVLSQSWSSDLAYVAGFNARGCQLKHDRCRNTIAYRQSGQNLAIAKESRQVTSAEAHIKRMIGNWFDEHVDADMSTINALPAGPGKPIGHFTQMVQQHSGRLGCAVVEFRESNWYTIYMACNYASANMLGEPVYDVGEPCSDCAGACSKRWTGLCAGASGRYGGRRNWLWHGLTGVLVVIGVWFTGQ